MQVPVGTNYSDRKNWGLYGYTSLENPLADIFYVHPTTYVFDAYKNGGTRDFDALNGLAQSDRSPINADLCDEKLNRYTDSVAMVGQGTLYGQAGRVFAPRYRQAHMRVFYLGFDHPQTLAANALAVADVKAAFLHYMTYENRGRPFILVGHSQGSHTLSVLLQRLTEHPNAACLKRLIAAYLPGFAVSAQDLKHLPFLDSPDGTGGYLSWNCFKEGGYPKHYRNYLGKTGLGINPMTFTRNTDVVIKPGSDKKRVSLSFRYDRASGLVMVGAIGEEPKSLRGIYNLHPYDISFFKEEIVENMKLRIKSYYSRGGIPHVG